ncbi:MAG TPA: peptidase, partial [Porticoccaceae bacterium]|nr:peptidase [Porticoccaceae bacterium]
PIADIYAREHSADVIAERLVGSELLLLDVVLENLDEIVQRFVQV